MDWGSQRENRFIESALLARRDWLMDFLRKRGLVLLWSSFQQKIVYTGSFASGGAGRYMQHDATALVGDELRPLSTDITCSKVKMIVA